MNATIPQKAKLIKLNFIEGRKCFGCSPANSVGLKMAFFANDTHVFSWITVADHFCGWNEFVHGGILATVLDEIMGRAAVHFLNKFILTKSININFIKTVYTDTEIRAEGIVCKRLDERKVIMEGSIYNNKEELCTRSTGEYVLHDSVTINTTT